MHINYQLSKKNYHSQTKLCLSLSNWRWAHTCQQRCSLGHEYGILTVTFEYNAGPVKYFFLIYYSTWKFAYIKVWWEHNSQWINVLDENKHSSSKPENYRNMNTNKSDGN